MQLHILSDKIWFPPVEESLKDGLLAIGGDLSEERILLAYRNGIFPWFEDKVPLWWSPDPRFVLFPDRLKVSKSMQAIIRKDFFHFEKNKDFEAVITACRQITRNNQNGTWITEEVKKAYIDLHKNGYAISAEAYNNHGELVGGLYGILLGKIFFGESMFSKESNASKFAFIHLVKELKQNGIQLIDCQVYTQHLESLGAEMIDRKSFKEYLEKYV
ncbi:MAG: leucyl/phenylalanyl-tRNA--protein transferase [Arachidicoccus sp.]|nr:leucyl/phenylalanyl-tRNA--protein transferase [Arachidicoccus sp.]